MKIRLVSAKLFHADGETDRQTDMRKLIVASRNFENAPKSDYCENPTAHVGTPRGQNAVFFCLKRDGKYSNHCTSKG
jgi:hypothetical protein